MPYALVRNPNGSYAVQNQQTKHFASKHTTKTKAEAQIRLLRAIEGKKK